MTATLPEVERAQCPPREDVRRQATFALRSAEDTGDGNTLDGYAAVFNRTTVIDSWEGRFRERIAPGSMRKSFRENPPVIQFDHGSHPMIGSLPIARLESITEDSDPVLAPDGGAHVVGRLHQNWLMQPVRDAIASGSVSGMSFRFGVIRDEWHDAKGNKITDEQDLFNLLEQSWRENLSESKLPVRTLLELRVPELGPVVFPAYKDTSVGMRSKVTIDLGRLDDPDQRSLLARAVILADAVEAGHVDEGTPRSTSSEDVAPVEEPADVVEDAAEHLPESDGTPRSTSPVEGDAAEHLSKSTALDVRRMLEEMRADRAIVTRTRGRYSS